MRYAIYYTPGPDEGLSAAAARWLGRDVHSGRDCRQPDLDWLPPEELHALTADPRRYGFHGTLKAPFRLKDGVRREDLVAAVEQFAGVTEPVAFADGLKVAGLGPFFALVPATDTPGLEALASACVRAFESFRAPLQQEELQRRRRSGLTPIQDAYLEQWGYPYIFDEFRFHLTLTGQVPEAVRPRMLLELEGRFARHSNIPCRIGAIALFSQEGAGEAFRIETLFPLGGKPAGPRSK